LKPPKNPWGDNSRKSMEPGTKRTSNNWLKGKEEIIGFYVAGKTIGSGGVGTVRKAKHIETGEKVWTSLELFICFLIPKQFFETSINHSLQLNLLKWMKRKWNLLKEKLLSPGY